MLFGGYVISTRPRMVSESIHVVEGVAGIKGAYVVTLDIAASMLKLCRLEVLLIVIRHIDNPYGLWI